MGKQRQNESSEMASDVAEVTAQGNQPSHYEAQMQQQHGSLMGARAQATDAAAYREQVSVDVIHSLVYGIRIQVTPDMLAGDVAERLLCLHDQILKQLEQRGIIEPVEPAAE